MARIRTTKPEFWADEKLAPQPAITRLVYMGLWSMADDAGRIVDSVKQIDAFLFPETEDSSRESLDTLTELKRIVRGRTASGQPVIQIVNWHHQKIDHPNMKAALPPITGYKPPKPKKASRKAREQFANDSREDRDGLATLSVPPTSTSDLRPVPGPPSGNGTGTGDQGPKPARRPEPSPRLRGTAPAANGTSKCGSCDGRHGFHSPDCPTRSVAHA